MKNLGKKGLNDLIEKRYDLAVYLSKILKDDSDFILINEIEINSVVFMYKGKIKINDINKLNFVNKKIHELIIKDGKYHLHQFSIIDAGKIKKGEIIYPQRYMSGNPKVTKNDLLKMIEYVRILGGEVYKNLA